MIRQQFGPYLLFKKLGHDPLGETFRAGRIHGTSVDRVVLLRVYNGTTLSQMPLEQALRERHDITKVVRGPQIARGVDHGRLDGVPYSAYEYCSSQDLRTVAELARKRGQPVPADQALLIVERLALGLCTAYESTYGDRGVRHGFVVPEFVQISTEGEVQLLGFEVGEALRKGASERSIDPDYVRYLSPEAVEGEPLASSDDVYSLGILLLELAANEKANDPRVRETMIERVSQSHPAIGNLIRRSIVDPAQRIANVPSWHQEVSKILPDSGSSTFQLAFYLHNLLSDEIAREARELKDESDIAIPIVSSSPPAAPPAPPRAGSDPTSSADDLLSMPSGSPPKSEDSGVLVADPAFLDQVLGDTESPLESVPLREPQRHGEGSSRSSSLTGGQVALAAALVMAIAAGAYFIRPLLQETPDATPAARVAAATTTEPSVDMDLAATATPLPASTEGSKSPADTPSAEDVMARIDELVSDRTDSIEKSLRSEYDREIRLLRQQLNETRKTADLPMSTAPDAKPDEAQEDNTTEAVPASRQVARLDRAASPGAGALTLDRSLERPEPRASEPRPGAPKPGGPTSDDPRESQPKAGASSPTSESEAERPTAVLGTSAPNSSERSEVEAAATVKEADTAPAENPVTPPALAKPISPRYPPLAQRLSKEAVVELRVFVESDGTVSEVRGFRKHGFGFDESAERAARSAKFEPAKRGGAAISTWTTMRIAFRLER